MSAIAGVFVRRGAAMPGGSLAASLAALTSYGRDGSDYWVQGPAGVGHQLTSIQPEDDLETLPLVDPSAGLVVTADARLDNRHDLCLALGFPGPEHKSLPIGRLLLTAWQKWGQDCPRHLEGDYAFAIWDTRRQTMFCARDHIGARALYYSLTPNFLVFASDIKGVLAAPGVSDTFDDDYVTASLADKRFYQKDRTYFKDVRRLAPGHTLTVQAATERLDRYWFPEDARRIRFANDRDYAGAAREIYERAVRNRVQTKWPLGVHLSGGLDSSSVTALAARECRRQGGLPPKVLSWQPPPDEATKLTREYLQIEAVCTREGLSPIYCPANADDILTVLSKDPAREPAHTTLRGEVSIQREAAEQGVRLILSGWGGDEGLSFDGRGYYSQMLLRGRWGFLLEEGRRHGAPWRFVAREAVLLMFPDRNEALKQIFARSLRLQPMSASFLHPDLHRQVRLHMTPCRQSTTRSTMLWLWNCGCLAERMEAWAAHGALRGISYAYPMLDRRLLDFVAGLPSEQFVRGPWTRWLMRNTMEGILPAEVCWQPDKAEPMRFDNGFKAARQVVVMARERLSAAAQWPSRARYLDMPRLLARMSPEQMNENFRPGDILRALQFLDF